MSFKFYSKLWVSTKKDLESILQQEHTFETLKPTQDRLFAHRIFASIFPRYVVLCNNLSDIYDQTLQVQKRKVIGEFLEAATRRLQELHKQLCDIELSEIVYVDRTLIENKLTPQNITILKPFYFPCQRTTEIQNLINDHCTHKDKQEVADDTKEVSGIDKFRVKLTAEQLEAQRVHNILVDAVNLIKSHEKARQARIWKNNIDRDPITFKPSIQMISEQIKYDFYYKPDTVMLFPIKRTTYSSNFYQDLTDFGSFKFYKKPVFTEEDKPQFGQKIRKKSKKLTIIEPVEVRTSINDESHLQDELLSENIIDDDTKEIEEKNRAALRIQNAWQDYKLRHKIKEEQIKRLLVYNMINERKFDFTIENKIKVEREARRAKKLAFDTAFIQAVEDEKARILKFKSPWLMEDISDHVREWFRQFYYSVKNFDRYPEVFEGGTILVIRGDTMDPDEFEEKQAQMAADKLKTPEQKAKEKENKKLEKEKLKEQARQKKLKKKKEIARLKELEKQGKFYLDFKKDPEERVKCPIATLETTFEKYEEDWYFINELSNPKEDPIMEWITIDKYAEIHQELRPIVDEFMRIEYELLRQALAKDNRKKYKPQKPKKQRKKKEKRGKKKKAQVNLLEEHSIEELYEELVNLKIIEKYEKCSLDDYISDMNYRAYERRQQMLDSIHGLQELKNTIRTSIFGIGPLDLPKPKSICFAGPPLSGKKFLMRAICSETDSVLFDLSPAKLKPIEDMKYFVTLVTQMARILQPAILFIDGAHKPFYKKVPKEEQEQNPKKLGQFLIKSIVKPIMKDEKIMLIGTTNEPWKASIGKMKKCYEKIFLIPKTDYGNTFIAWRHTLLQKLNVQRDICLSSLSKVTEGISIGQIIKCVDECVDLRRRMEFSRKKLTLEELLEYFLTQDPIVCPMSLQIFEKYKKWFVNANKYAKKQQKQILLANPPAIEEKGAKAK